MARLGLYLCLMLIALSRTGSEARPSVCEFGRSMVLVDSPKTMAPAEFEAVGPKRISPEGPDPKHHAIISRECIVGLKLADVHEAAVVSGVLCNKYIAYA
ncbi:hypothetical protein BT93_E1531 [Corymbia citriodora subsp. variegata]|nr:hypothetical protein BT93_E1531 [Corymbia citriodora subsp. variegata]